MSPGLFSLPELRPQRDNMYSCTGIHMLSVPCLESMAVVHVSCTEMEVPCSCGIDGQIHHHNNPNALIVISCVCTHAQTQAYIHIDMQTHTHIHTYRHTRTHV